ncbi:TonB-dependent receptor domain-containing protein [Paremcibacter congregatus]|uniref:TonB-dependent receptor domain-containing protein n=1 Tax=Paremcibacter congregatus TaxID=2043170 RepID=UPI003A8EDB5C
MKNTPLSRCLARHLLVGASSLVLLSAAAPALAQDYAQDYTFNIASTSLGKALIRFSEKTDLQVIYVDPEIAKASTRGISGTMSVEDALKQLLAGTSYGYEISGKNVRIFNQAKTPADSTTSQTTGGAGIDAANNGALEEIVTIGTRRKGRTVADSNVPVDVLNASDLAATGLTETNQLLANLLPSFNFPQSAVNDGTDHVRPAQLRGLAPDHTLVLVNGKRRHSSAMLNLNGSAGRGSTSVDLNMIPANAIKRIEVLRDGAAAQYGSDAIVGVINIVLNDAPEGVTMSATYGQHVTTMDGVPQLESVTIGDDGNLVFKTGKDRTRNDGETLTLRGNLGLPIGEEGFFNLSFEYRDRNPTNRSDYDSREIYDRIDGALDPRELTYDRYNTRYGNSAVEDVNVFFNAGVPINDTFESYFSGSIGKRTGESGGFNRLAKDSRNVPEIYSDGFLPLITSDIDDKSLSGGVRGEIAGWDADFSATYGENKFAFGVINSLNTSLGPNSPTEFKAGTLKNSQMTLNAEMNKLLDLGLPNPVNVAFGVEYRDEKYKIAAGEVASYIKGDFGGAAGSQVFPGFTPESEVDDGRHSIGAYIEFDADLTERLNVAIAGRFEDYSDFGSTVNGKIATRYELTEELAFRGAVSTGYRAPSLAQQFFTSIATVFVDGVPTETGTFRPSSPVAQALGSPGLEAEKSLNFSAGFIWQPVDGLSVTVDYYNIKIDDRIVLSSNLSGAGVEALLAGTGANRARFFLNGIDSRTQGVDLVANYIMDLEDWGQLTLNAGFNYNNSKVTDVVNPPSQLADIGVEQDNLFDFNEFRRFEKGSPETKLNLSASWFWEQLRLTARTTRYGETHDPSSNPDRYEVLAPAWVTDIDVSYEFTENISVAVGANNVFDVYPEATRDIVTDVTTFSRIFPYSGFTPYGFNGRYLYARLTARY